MTDRCQVTKTCFLRECFRIRVKELCDERKLTKREAIVFVHLMEGEALVEIAATLAMKHRTVKFHQSQILQKLGADSRMDLLRVVLNPERGAGGVH
jgi:DNA-binding NarL/FixJ family response regulator